MREREITSRHARLARFLRAAAAGCSHPRTRMRRRRAIRRRCWRGDSTCARPTARRKWPTIASRVSAARSRRCCSRISTKSRPMTASGPMPACCTFPAISLRDVLARIWRALRAGRLFLRQLQDRRRRRPRYAQSLLQLPVARLAARHLRAGGDAGVHWRSRAAKSEASTTNRLRCCLSSRARRLSKNALNWSQTILKIASASTAWAMKPTVKASVRNTGRPSV